MLVDLPGFLHSGKQCLVNERISKNTIAVMKEITVAISFEACTWTREDRHAVPVVCSGVVLLFP